MNLSDKIQIAILGVLIFGIIFTVFFYRAKIATLQNEILKLELIIQEKDKDILNAHSALEQQNMLIESFEADKSASAIQNAAELEKIKNRYEFELNEVKKILGSDNSCEQQLYLIYHAQQAFLYE